MQKGELPQHHGMIVTSCSLKNTKLFLYTDQQQYFNILFVSKMRLIDQLHLGSNRSQRARDGFRGEEKLRWSFHHRGSELHLLHHLRWSSYGGSQEKAEK
jgi:hypothetical protein